MTAKALCCLKWGFVLLFFNINIGRLDLLPDFLGMVLIILGVRSQQMTETERRVQPLLFVLAVDFFVHWIFAFDNELENLVITVINIYGIYILLGEIAGRIKETFKILTDRLHYIRIGFVVLQLLHYLLGAYDNEGVVMALSIGFVILLVILLVTLFAVDPEDVETNSHCPV